MHERRLESEGFLDLRNTSLRFCGATLVVGTGEGFADLGLDRNLEIELDLRLRTRRTDGYLQATLREVLKYVRSSMQRHVEIRLNPLAVLEFALLEASAPVLPGRTTLMVVSRWKP